MAWRLEGDETRGFIEEEGERYPYWLEDGLVHVGLPFAVDTSRLRELLNRDRWAVAVADERVDSLGWGEAYDVEGYYPYRISRNRRQRDGAGATVLTFPPQDYRIEGEPGRIVGHEEPEGASSHPRAHRPVVASDSLETFARWIEYLRQARK